MVKKNRKYLKKNMPKYVCKYACICKYMQKICMQYILTNPNFNPLLPDLRKKMCVEFSSKSEWKMAAEKGNLKCKIQKQFLCSKKENLKLNSNTKEQPRFHWFLGNLTKKSKRKHTLAHFFCWFRNMQLLGGRIKKKQGKIGRGLWMQGKIWCKQCRQCKQCTSC